MDITVRDAAKRLRVSESSIRRYFDAGKLQGYRTPSGVRRISESSVAALEEQVGLAPPGITFP